MLLEKVMGTGKNIPYIWSLGRIYPFTDRHVTTDAGKHGQPGIFFFVAMRQIAQGTQSNFGGTLAKKGWSTQYDCVWTRGALTPIYFRTGLCKLLPVHSEISLHTPLISISLPAHQSSCRLMNHRWPKSPCTLRRYRWITRRKKILTSKWKKINTGKPFWFSQYATVTHCQEIGG